jgi:drug/metabolite transporter (DMT)-like permease
MNEKTKARIAVLLGNFFFGTSVIAVKHISPSIIPAIGLTAIRILVTTFLFWGFYAIKPVKTGISKKDYRLLFLCSFAGIAMNQSFTVKGMSLTSPIHTSLLILTTPICITLLAAWFLKESLTKLKVFGLLLGVSGGVLLIFSRDLSTKAGAEQSLGDFFVIIGAISYSVYVVSIKPLMQRYKAMHILQWVFLFGCIAAIPLGWKPLSGVNWALMEGLSWFALLYVVFGATFFAYLLMNYSISKLGASITGSYIYTQPFFATVASMILLHETLSITKIAAAVLIMGGVFLANFKK